jgi:DNA-binding beta-propeller fold protein YncE
MRSVIACALPVALLAVTVLGATAADVPAVTDSTAATRADSVSATRPDSVAVARADSVAAASDSLPFRLRTLDPLATATPGPGQVVRPAGLAVDAFGRLYVSDAAQHKIQRFDERGHWLGESGSLGSGTGQMRRPGALAMIGTLGVAVLDVENRRILSYDLFGRLTGTLIELDADDLVGPLGRVDPRDLAADRGGAVYVADAERDRILAFDFSGRYQRTIGGYGARPGSFRGLAGLAVARRGELITAERINARVQRLDSGGRVIASWRIAVKPGRAALAVAVDDSAHIAVADEASGTLWVFDPAGRMLASFSGLSAPSALAFARDGRLLVAEAGAGRVRRFAIDARAAGKE